MKDKKIKMEHSMVADKTRFGLVGVGGYAKIYLDALELMNKQGLIELCGVIIRNKKKYSKTTDRLCSRDIPVYPDLEALFESDSENKIDVVAIPTAIHFHAPMTRQCLSQGYNVLVEKPVAATVQEVDGMMNEKNKARRFCAVGYQHIYGQSMQEVKKRICEGKLGAIKSLKCYAVAPRGSDYYNRNSWAGRLKVDGKWILDSPHNNAFAHYINIMCFLAGSKEKEAVHPQAVIAELYRANKIEAADTVCLRMKTEEGPEIFFAGSHSAEGPRDIRIVVEAEKGTVLWLNDKFEITYNQNKKEYLADKNDPVIEMFKNVCRAAKGQLKEPYCNLEISRAQTLCVNGSFESSAIVTIPEENIKRKQEANNNIMTIVADIDTILKESFHERKLFSEMGLTWAGKGEWVDLRNYVRFPSFKKHGKMCS